MSRRQYPAGCSRTGRGSEAEDVEVIDYRGRGRQAPAWNFLGLECRGGPRGDQENEKSKVLENRQKTLKDTRKAKYLENKKGSIIKLEEMKNLTKSINIS